MGEGYAAKLRGGRAACGVGAGGSQMTHSAGSVTTQRKAFSNILFEKKGKIFTKRIGRERRKE